MNVLRDYGALARKNELPTYPENSFNINSRGLVYLATHEGELRLPFMNRSFISFTYGGKYIEDFNLIATVTGDRMSRNGYAEFVDTVTTYDNLDGEHYWATHFSANKMDFTLSTDGIDLKMLDDFLHWFRPGISRELVLSEHPNRGIMARVSSAPTLDLLPFETEIEMIISGVSYTTKTTLFKGDINLSFTMELPHWYALVNILGKKSADGTRYIDMWDDIKTGRTVSIFASLDALKILYEDGIPLGSMIQDSMLLGNGAYASAGQSPVSCIYDPDTDIGARIYGTVRDSNPPTYFDIVALDYLESIYPPGEYVGYIAGAIVDISGNGIVLLLPGMDGYFFYSGTAPAPTIITFTLYPCLENDYIAIPSNTYAQYSENNRPYNTITVESENALTLRFTTPNVYTSYNKAIDLIKHVRANTPWEDLRKSLRDLIRHARVREWAIKCLDVELLRLGNNSLTVNTNSITTIVSHMTQFLKNESGDLYPVTFSFNSETGEAIGTFTYRLIDNTLNVLTWSTYGLPSNLNNATEDVGDMLLSNYIILLDRNYPTEGGSIVKWDPQNATTKRNSHHIIHDIGYGAPEITVDGEPITYPGITNLQVLYKNMYL